MGTLGIEVLEEYLESVSTKVKLTNGQEWLLREGQAIFVCYLFIDGEQVSYEVNRKSLAEIYSQIRFLYDKDGKVIAQRSSEGGRLLTTRKNDWISCSSKKTKKKTALDFYQLIEKIEDRRYAQEMLNHVYRAKTKRKTI